MRDVLFFTSLSLALPACGSDWRYRDLDGDGISPANGDCWDKEEGPEGSGLSGLDIGPHVQETWYDGVDQDCAGDDDFDADGDGWVPEAEFYQQVTLGVPKSGDHLGYGDCWDAPPDTIIPVEYVGVDGSIFTPPEVNPGEEDSWYDAIDQDCMSDDDFDQDLDGYASSEHENREGEVGEDCADTDSAIHPDAEEICDEIDNDCDDLIDTDDDSVNLDDLPTWYADIDEDGFGDPDAGDVTCERPDGYVEESLATDCDDADEEINPDSDELCDEIDNDCDDLIDDEDDDLVSDSGEPFYLDDDGDGFGNAENATLACEQPSGYTTDASDCDDGDAQINPDADELCATVGVDDDCDGEIDEAEATDTSTYYMDGDGDGYGDPDVSTDACSSPSGYSSDDTDCDDSDADVSPAETEICNGVDDDCDGDVDDADSSLDTLSASTWYADSDEDGFGDASESAEACEQPDAYVGDDTDCDDGDASINPDAEEVCDELDNDCDGDVDDADTSLDTGTAETWYADADEDGFGDAESSTTSCEQPTDHVDDATDCDDSDDDINPDAAEICDDVDNDCDGDVDDADSSLDSSTSSTFYEDSDGDGYGSSSRSTEACEMPSGTAANDDDCDDADADVNPDAEEVCDELDNDCDGDIDEEDSDLDLSTVGVYYLDADGDGYGSSTGPTEQACEMPSGYTESSDDCDDSDSDVNPGADEVCNDGIDNDCDGSLGLTAAGGTCEWVDLSLAAANVLFTGSAAQDVAGGQVMLLPDVDGDGIADLAIAAPYEDTGANASGSIYLYTGLDSLDSDSQEAWDLDTTHTVMFTGTDIKDHAGQGIAGGDFDGDGYGDLLITAHHNDDGASGAGIGYIFYGPVTDVGTLSLADADSSYEGYGAEDYAGWSASMQGDIDGDGCDDIMVGAPQDPLADPSSSTSAGEGYVFLIPGSQVSSDCSGAGDFILYYGEEDEDGAGYSLGFVDTDGDGDSEVLIGAPQADLGGGSKSGAVYLSNGDESGLVELGTDMVSFTGESASDRAGWAVSGSGDTNDDGYDDILISAWQDDDGATNGGAVYVFLGPVAISDTEISLSTADAKLIGGSTNDGAGYDVDFGGTLNDDDYDDVLVGAWKQDDGATDAGGTYVVLGPVTGSMDLDDADALLSGIATSDQSGTFLSGGQDVNDDGLDDILIGARYADDGGTSSGAAYLILGLGQ